jgi:hypothetical protein
MFELLLIYFAVCAAVIMVVVSVMVMRWRRSSDQLWMPRRERRGAVAELAAAGMAQYETAIVPGFSHDTVERNRRSNEPEPPEQAAESQVSGVADPEPSSDGPGAEPDDQQAAADAVTSSERIASYYDEADRRMAEYLAAQGWTQERGTQGPG